MSPSQRRHLSFASPQILTITLASDQTLMTAGYTILMFLSLTGNALVIGAFYRRYDQLQTPVNYFIINMAVSDLLVPFFVFPKHIQEVYLGWGPIIVSGVLGDIVCKITSFAEDVSASVSSQSMLFIAAERFSSIVIPQKWPLISRQTTPRFLGFTWVFSSVFFSYCFYIRKVVDNKERTLCTYKLPQGFDSWQELWKTERLTFLVGFVAIPFIIMVIFYTVIVVTLHRQVKAALSEVQKRHVKQTQRVTLMLISVVAVFFISWIPFYIYFCLHFYSLDINRKLYLHCFQPVDILHIQRNLSPRFSRAVELWVALLPSFLQKDNSWTWSPKSTTSIWRFEWIKRYLGHLRNWRQLNITRKIQKKETVYP